jgi:hypothetical protein
VVGRGRRRRRGVVGKRRVVGRMVGSLLEVALKTKGLSL